MKAAWRGALAALLALGCAEQPVELPLRSLERSGESAFVCVGRDENGQPVGRDIDDCPDFELGPNRLLALVTQTLRGEVAVVDLTNERVVDTNPAIPGFTFLPVGSNPVDIVALPDGSASFVASTELGREGLFALPTTEIEQPRDLTDWPACSLPSAPAALAVIQSTNAACAEPKLAVALPDRGEVWLLDARRLQDRPRGGFESCLRDSDDGSVVALETQAAGALPNQRLPADLETPDSCGAPPAIVPVPGLAARPVDLALGDGRLYVADQGVPLVHVLDVSNPCAASEQEPLLPMSFETPGRTVLTKKVAVSPETVAGQRFVYAIDDSEGTLMVFDVSRGSTNRTPLVRSGAPRTPFEPADRISFDSPVRDIEFVIHDVPEPDPDTGLSVSGTFCDPDPALPEDQPGARYRPTPNRSSGAGPRLLRGIFGMAALANGRVVVIDVEDWDAACRRPVETNPAPEPDFRGCRADPDIVSFRTEGDLVTVSAEASCSAIEPHRPRSANYLVTSSTTGARAPSLRNTPRLSSENGFLPSDQTEEGRRRPKLLAVPFPPPWPKAQDPAAPDENLNLCGDVWVGTSRQRMFCDDAGNPLPSSEVAFDPALASGGSLLLSQVEPRSHLTEDVLVSYEGRIMPDRDVGILSFLEQDPDDARLVLRDADAGFCSLGVQDSARAAETALELPLAEGATVEQFARHHADYVQITSDFLEEDDPYWDRAKACEAFTDPRAQCESLFGSPETPNTARDFRILGARQSHLLLEPRELGGANWAELRRDLQCCFPSSVRYTVRAGHHWVVLGSSSGFRHDQFPDPGPIPAPPPEVEDPRLLEFYRDRGCTRAPECNPRRQLLKSRVYEVSSATECDPEALEDDPSLCPVGTPTGDGEDLGLACHFAFEPGAQWLNVSDAEQARCVFENMTARFAIYRGAEPSERDFSFAWQTVGGFVPLFTELATAQSAAVLPQSLEFVPQLNQLAVVDGATQGLVLINLDTVGLEALYF